MFKRKKNEFPEESRACGYCEHATLLGDSGTCICDGKGIVQCDGFCKSFAPDLLKLKPRVLRLTDPEENKRLFEEIK